MNHKHFMKIALDHAKSSLSEGEFPVGCAIEYEGKVLASSSRKHTTGKTINEVDHAEIVALKKFSEFDNINRENATLYSTLEPCLMCYGAILLSGIGQIVYAYEDVMGGGTGCDLTKLTPLYNRFNVPVISNILREKSLGLFKEYFSNPKTLYWKGSLLASYTLEQ
ncbi:MAG: nucleoside deaminase [Desulfobacterales bacterium]|nr:nucleoside deaminase [Desulfobacteraceae bacterium]MBT4364213.1 nucleoside deaminase [Desulfobacteraceae bacterium]MBT7086131.1 nucleoside deaminase [Desulfobacterales bacterium]